MRVARLVINKGEYGSVLFSFGTWNANYRNNPVVHIMPDSYFEINRLQDRIRIESMHILLRHKQWYGAFIERALLDITRLEMLKEEIYPSSLKNKHILTVKQSIYYAWRNIKQSAKCLLKHKKWPFFKYDTKLWMGS